MNPDGEIAWAPSKCILFQRPGNRNFHWVDPATGEEQSLVANDSVGWILDPHISPDGQQVAVYWNRRNLADRETWVIFLHDSSVVRLRPGNSDPVGWSVPPTSPSPTSGWWNTSIRMCASCNC